MASSLDENYGDDVRGCWKDSDPRVPQLYQRFSAGAPELALKYENANFEALIIDESRTPTYTEEMLDVLLDWCIMWCDPEKLRETVQKKYKPRSAHRSWADELVTRHNRALRNYTLPTASL